MHDQPSEEAIQQIIALIGKLVNPKHSQEEQNEVLDELGRFVPHPAPTDLIFWPEKELTHREMAIEMLSYRPTPLGYTP